MFLGTVELGVSLKQTAKMAHMFKLKMPSFGEGMTHQ